jgi:sulfite reductase (ferredoxin)
MAETGAKFDEAVESLHIKISGCYNSCGQHHVADLGFYGVSRKFAGYAVPHFQVVLGGEWEHNAGSYGLPVAAVPSKNIPKVVTRLTERYLAGRTSGRDVQGFRQANGQGRNEEHARRPHQAATLLTVPSSATGAIRGNTA